MRNVSFTHRSGFPLLCLALSACGAATEGEADEVETISAVQQPAVIGDRKVAAIFIRFNTSPTPTYTVNDVRDRLFNNADSTSKFFHEASCRKMNLTGHVNPDGDYSAGTINAAPTSYSLRPTYAAMGGAIAATADGYVESITSTRWTFFSRGRRVVPTELQPLGSSTYFYGFFSSPTLAPSRTSWDTTWGCDTPTC